METMKWLYDTETRLTALYNAQLERKADSIHGSESHDIGRGCKLDRKIVANIFQKPLDKTTKVWYNKYVSKARAY